MSAPLDDLMGNSLSEPVSDAEEASEELEIDVVDDRPEEDQRPARFDRGSEEAAGEIKKVGSGTGERIKKLKYNYHEERRAKEKAERMSKEAVRYAEKIVKENSQLKGLRHQGEKVLIAERNTRANAN